MWCIFLLMWYLFLQFPLLLVWTVPDSDTDSRGNSLWPGSCLQGERQDGNEKLLADDHFQILLEQRSQPVRCCHADVELSDVRDALLRGR